METNQILVASCLILNLIVLMLIVRKFNLLENIFMLRWKGVTVSLLFIVIGFFVWFCAEAIEPIFYSVYQELLPVSFVLLAGGQIILAYILLKKRVT